MEELYLLANKVKYLIDWIEFWLKEKTFFLKSNADVWHNDVTDRNY